MPKPTMILIAEQSSSLQRALIPGRGLDDGVQLVVGEAGEVLPEVQAVSGASNREQLEQPRPGTLAPAQRDHAERLR